jgi:hypothetical protein
MKRTTRGINNKQRKSQEGYNFVNGGNFNPKKDLVRYLDFLLQSKFNFNEYVDKIYTLESINELIRDYKNGKFYNFGYYIHTSNINTDFFYPEPEMADPPDVVQSLCISLKESNTKSNTKSNKENIYSLVLKDCVKNKFISNIMDHASKDSVLSILIYYYLQKHLNNYDTIMNVELELGGKYYKIKYDNTLEQIYNRLENEL